MYRVLRKFEDIIQKYTEHLKKVMFLKKLRYRKIEGTMKIIQCVDLFSYQTAEKLNV